jgi:CRISPR-associated protein Csc1
VYKQNKPTGTKMYLYKIIIQTEDYLRFSSREIGKLMETAPIINQTALNYALGLVEQHPYHFNPRVNSIKYRFPVDCLVFPAIPINYKSSTYTQKFERNGEKYSKPLPKQQDTRINLPMLERYKDIRPETIFFTYLISKFPKQINHWVRIGKKLAKCEILQEPIEFEQKEGRFTSSHPQTGLQLTKTHELVGFQYIYNCPPTSIVVGANLIGKYLSFNGQQIPCSLN